MDFNDDGSPYERLCAVTLAALDEAESGSELVTRIDPLIRFRALEKQLRASLVMALPEEPAALAKRVELLGKVRSRCSDLGVAREDDRLDVLGRIQRNLRRLRGWETPAELVRDGAAELLNACGFTRAMISKVDSGKFTPLVYRSVAAFDPVADTFPSWAYNTSVPLKRGLVEAELVRRRIPGFIANTVGDSHVDRKMMDAGQVLTYVAAPITVGGRIRGLIHCDHIGQDRLLTSHDRDNLWTFSKYYGFMHERLELLVGLHSQRTEMQAKLRAMEEVLDELWEDSLALSDRELKTAGAGLRGCSSTPSERPRLGGLLTSREQDVLEILMTGATNGRIAEILVISEGTVKSHVKHILAKLHAGTRSAAIAKYLQLTQDGNHSVGVANE